MIWILLFGAFVYFVYTKFYKILHFWKDKGVTAMDPWEAITSTCAMIFKRKHIFDVTKEQYNAFPNDRYYGLFTLSFSTQTLVVRDVDLIKQIGVKDFEHFTDHLTVLPPEVEPLFSKNLIAMKGQAWRDMRSTLSPAFTSSKMKGMFALMVDCAEDFTQFLYEKYGDKVEEVELKDLFTRFTNDVIATTAFGIKCDSLRQPDNSFYTMGKTIVNFDGWAILKLLCYGWFPKLMKYFRVRVLAKPVADFFTGMIMETVQKRQQENIIRPDMIHLLMEARKGNLKHEASKDSDAGFATVEESDIGKAQKQQKMEITDEDLTAQALIFFFAGFDTTSTAMCFTGLELAINPDVQQRLIEEIDETREKYGKKITYEGIMQMKYLDQVLSEALRKWTPAVQTDRLCVKDYTIEPVKPGEKPLLIEKGTLMMLLITGVHYDPKYFPNPDKFDPDRFSDENKGSIVPGSYMPFGVGPRNCIGSRFALLEIKILFYHLLSKFELVVGQKTTVPIKISKTNLDLRPENGFWIGLKARKTAT